MEKLTVMVQHSRHVHRFIHSNVTNSNITTVHHIQFSTITPLLLLLCFSDFANQSTFPDLLQHKLVPQQGPMQLEHLGIAEWNFYRLNVILSPNQWCQNSKWFWLHLMWLKRLFTVTDRSQLGLVVIGQINADLFGSRLTCLLHPLLPARLNNRMPSAPDFLLQFLMIVLACQIRRKRLNISHTLYRQLTGLSF